MADRLATLHGIRVLDATDALGVYTTRVLADLGADVVRVEPPSGDLMRSFPPFASGPRGEVSLYYAHFNAGKRAITLDLDWDGADEHFEALLRTCHAVVESGMAAGLLSARIPWERLAAIRPGLVLTSITPYGLDGPRRDALGGDLVVSAWSGLLHMNGSPGRSPFRPGGEQSMHMASLLAVNGTLLALFDQQRTGRGCRLEVPVDCATSLALSQFANPVAYTWHGRVPGRRGLGTAEGPSIYQTADGWMLVTALPGQWEKLVGLLVERGAADDLAEERYLDLAYRIENRAHVTGVIAAFVRTQRKQELFEAGQRAGFATAPVNDAADLANDPFLNQRGYFRELYYPELERNLKGPGAPFRMVGRPAGPERAAPAPGQDDQTLWVEELGFSAERFDALHAEHTS